MFFINSIHTWHRIGHDQPVNILIPIKHDKRMKVFSTEGAKKGFLKSEDLL